MIRPDMPYGDRFTLAVKDFGRKVIIKINRGKAVCGQRGKLVTITYKDSPVLRSQPGVWLHHRTSALVEKVRSGSDMPSAENRTHG